MLAGESRSYADEVEGCYGVRPTHTDEAVFAAAHERLEELLPGDGPLAERYERWEDSIRVPAEQIERTVAAVDRGGARAGRAAWSSCRPAKESSWRSCATSPGWRSATTSATCAAGSRSTSTCRCRPSSCSMLAMHETYPGHHAERACKEQLLVRGRGLLEETLVLVPDAAVARLRGDRQARAVRAARGRRRRRRSPRSSATPASSSISPTRSPSSGPREPCRWAEVNAALMLHDGGASEAEVRAYLERWGLMTPELAAHMIRFLKRADLADVHHHLPGRARALPRLRRGRAGALPPPADRAGARPRPARRPAVRTRWADD